MRNFALFALVLGLVACRDTSGGGDDQPGPDGGNTDDIAIYDIHGDTIPACDRANPASCTELKIKGVVVTAIDSFGDRKNEDIWVQEPDGGPFSGIQVYRPSLDQIAGLAVGDIVDISGAVKFEHAHSSDTSGNTITELGGLTTGSMKITKVGSGTPLEPHVVDALAIGQMKDYMAREAEWEKWEGVLVTVTNVEAFSGTSCITSQGNCNDPTYQRFNITGDIQVQSSLAAMPDPTVKRGDCLGSITGVVGYFFDYQILPRTTAEIATGGTGCPVENTVEACGDDIDNNGNGFADCMDFACQQAVPACVPTATISAIQMGTSKGLVTLDEVYVTAVSFNKRHLWVASSPAAAAYEGIYVYRGPNPPDLGATIVPGAKVLVRGAVQENNNDAMGDTMTQIGSNPTVTLIEMATESTTPTGVTGLTAASLLVASTGEPYESVLVTLANVKVTVQGTNQNFGVGELEQGATKFAIDDDIYRLPGAAGTCYASVTGIWTYSVYNNRYELRPTSKVDGGTCN